VSTPARTQEFATSFRDLYRSQVGYVWNVLRRFGVGRADLEDVTQDTFLRAYRSYASYDPARPLRPWLFALAARAAIDFRKRAHQREIPQELPDVVSDTEGPEARVELNERQRLLQKLLGELSDDLRAVFIMYEYYGHSAPEIAQALDIPLNTAYSRLRLARAQFAAAAQRTAAEPP